MQGAKYAWAHDHAKTTNDVPTDSDLFGPTTYLEHKPTCPAEGTYTIGKVGEPVKCSIPTHKISDPKSRR